MGRVAHSLGGGVSIGTEHFLAPGRHVIRCGPFAARRPDATRPHSRGRAENRASESHRLRGLPTVPPARGRGASAHLRSIGFGTFGSGGYHVGVEAAGVGGPDSAREQWLRERLAFLLVELLKLRGAEQKAALAEIYGIRVELGEVPDVP